MENKSENKLTEREIFEQIVALQTQLTENNAHSLHRLVDAMDCVYSDDNEAGSEQISEVCNVFSMREHNLRIMLEFYIKMYDDVKKIEEERKADLIKGAFSEISSKIKASDLPSEDKLSALLDITDATKELVMTLLTSSN
ncbi:MAG: hypothetical protein IJZ93_00210 [Clostridia bacterium]|nr:hypothetical protein [Clostridia bacterium]